MSQRERDNEGLARPGDCSAEKCTLQDIVIKHISKLDGPVGTWLYLVHAFPTFCLVHSPFSHAPRSQLTADDHYVASLWGHSTGMGKII